MAEVSKYRVCRERRCRGDLECVKISRLRATGVVTEAMTEIAVRLGDVEAIVGLWHHAFPQRRRLVLFPLSGVWSEGAAALVAVWCDRLSAVLYPLWCAASRRFFECSPACGAACDGVESSTWQRRERAA